LGSNATLVIDGTGLVPGSQYDQLSVTGAVAIGNCALQVTSLPSVPIGATFTIITNNGGGAVTGIFNGLPENALISVGSQPFRIHYAGGDGNDVTLVRDTGPVAPVLSAGNAGNGKGAFQLTGIAGSSLSLTILATTNFIQWTDIGTATSDSGGHFNFTDTNASQFRYRFYRTTN
jgi:hypothetical protein